MLVGRWIIVLSLTAGFGEGSGKAAEELRKAEILIFTLH
jgi:hypothetical protein